MKIPRKEFQKIRFRCFLDQLENKDWREGIWWTGTTTSLIGFYGMKETDAKKQMNWETFEIQSPLGSRIIGKQRLLRLLPFFIKFDSEGFYRGNPIYEELETKRTVSHRELIEKGIRPKEISKIVTELKRDWLVVIEKKGKDRIYHHWKVFLGEKGKENLENIIYDLFSVFGMMTLDGISMFLGVRPYYFTNVLTSMEREGVLYRPFRLREGKKDVFALTGIMDSVVDKESVQDVVLEDTDALASQIFLEEGKALGNKALLLHEGIPQAFFRINLKHKKLSISELEWIHGSVEEAQERIKRWGVKNGFNAEIDYRSSKLGMLTTHAIKHLMEKGYRISQGNLELIKGKTIKKEEIGHLDRTKGFDWLLKKQFLDFRSEQDIVNHVIQLNSLDCFAFRLGRKPNLEALDAKIGRGGNGRVGIMEIETFRAFSNVNQEDMKSTLIDKKIMKTLESYPGLTVTELSSQLNLPFSKVVQRVRFLEKRYRIARLGFLSFDDTTANWEINSLYGTMDENIAKGFLLDKLLQHHLPLTPIMISRFFGWDFKTVETTLDLLDNKGIVEKGQFIKYPDEDLQFAYKGRSDEIKKEKHVKDEMYFIPFEDPLSIIYFPMMIQLFPILQPRSLTELNNGMMVFRGSNLIGYISMSNVNHIAESGQRIRYVVNLRIRKEWINRDEVLNIFQNFIQQYNDYWGSWGSIGKINGRTLRGLFGGEAILDAEARGLNMEFT
ncbi:MAG: winged helix-turn-helix domain-containing protein [Methanobacteriota archaeon]|nr:MAG: winged helix-turn-helix domain-containing protein [Euryarchaeota archaeon]